ncbi:PTS sugar transporter subunit IIB [Sporolactobacillus laevolacticus]|jgi:PTS system galactitol-specific IIB component|uniref:PTS sugar transporter subunit IIB n=1 Tax=Sporolactobacillus laevolacticus TaxID=33018 RepID=UPI0025B419C3|nr:PTS sugar transporter subunit IIB [Sporolactobacillus laevolacticus]MDF2910528.1 galactitol transporter subunit [Sporolactobacillus laevolacticus]MDN3956656.1 PTS sugar transporter subunit IIB [Sporolactobacillus laevolacticus]
MKKILVACGAGIATSTVALSKLKDILKERGLINQVQFGQTTVAEIPNMASDYDLIVTTTNFSRNVGIPIVNGLSFIINMGIDKTVDEIVDKLELKKTS